MTAESQLPATQSTLYCYSAANFPFPGAVHALSQQVSTNLHPRHLNVGIIL